MTGARIEDYANTAPERALGPPLLAVAVALLAFDLLIALGLRGLLRPSRIAAALALRAAGRAWGPCARKQPQSGARHAARLYRHRRRPVGRRIARRGWRGCRNTSTGARQRHWSSPTLWSPARRSQLLSAALLADHRRSATAGIRAGGGAERLHEPRRDHPGRYARIRHPVPVSLRAPGRRSSGWLRGW